MQKRPANATTASKTSSEDEDEDKTNPAKRAKTELISSPTSSFTMEVIKAVVQRAEPKGTTKKTLHAMMKTMWGKMKKQKSRSEARETNDKRKMEILWAVATAARPPPGEREYTTLKDCTIMLKAYNTWALVTKVAKRCHSSAKVRVPLVGDATQTYGITFSTQSNPNRLNQLCDLLSTKLRLFFSGAHLGSRLWEAET
jgi:hypothetical protein